MFTITPRGGSMSEEILLNKQDQLAFAVAQGKSTTAWVRQNDLPRSTACEWADNPDFRRLRPPDLGPT